MKTTFLTFRFALVAYAIITLPTIVIPSMYGYSMVLAIGFGIAAWLLYTIIFMMLKSINCIVEIKWLLLIISIPICVATAYTLIGVFNVWNDVWQESELLLFPLAATVSGWISLYKTRNEIEEILNPITQEILIY